MSPFSFREDFFVSWWKIALVWLVAVLLLLEMSIVNILIITDVFLMCWMVTCSIIVMYWGRIYGGCWLVLFFNWRREGGWSTILDMKDFDQLKMSVLKSDVLVLFFSNQNTQEVKNECFIIRTRQYHVQILGTFCLRQSDELIFQTQSLRGWKRFTYDLQKWH